MGEEDGLQGSSPSVGPRKSRVVADAMDGFRYGKRLVYDWRFEEVGPGETDVRLDMFFQARNVFFLPLWDSMQATITSVMMKKFIERAAVLSDETEDGSRRGNDMNQQIGTVRARGANK